MILNGRYIENLVIQKFIKKTSTGMNLGVAVTVNSEYEFLTVFMSIDNKGPLLDEIKHFYLRELDFDDVLDALMLDSGTVDLEATQDIIHSKIFNYVQEKLMAEFS